MESLLFPASVGRVFFNESLSRFTTFRVGGPADVLIIPSSVEELAAALQFCDENDLPVEIIGRGSNVLISDLGVRGVTISISDGLSCLRFVRGANQITAGAGCTMTALAAYAARNRLTGLEFACGIPGSVGGAVLMNAGAYDGAVEHVVLRTKWFDFEGNEHEIGRSDHQFGYRHSVFKETKGVIAQVVFQLQPGERNDIYKKMADVQFQRREKQPIEFASAGSAFKRPEGYYAGKLIADSGLRGYRRVRLAYRRSMPGLSSTTAALQQLTLRLFLITFRKLLNRLQACA